MTQLIARRVHSLRTDKNRNLSGSALSKRVRGYGIRSWSDSTISKLETGRRESVTVSELLALALALDVPPALLIADPRSPDLIPVAEGMAVDPWEALLWLIGTGTIENSSLGNFGAASWLLHAGWTVVEALGDLRRVDRADEAARARELTDARHRNALQRIVIAFHRIHAQHAPAPTLAPWVYERANELGVELPKQPDPEPPNPEPKS